ncbi:MAG TPA: LacI family DNA-binding transcriptional regulator [Galbitalea sp.]|jgi:LacI family transcriptional regulator
MRHVAALAGVGVKTVSRVINEEPNVSEATIARVMEAAQRLNYQPNLHAGNLRRSDRKTQTLGLVVGSVANPFAGALHRAVEDAARERGTAVFASSLDDDPLRERDIVDAFLRRRVDGLILTTVTKNQSYLVPEQQHGTPLVFVDRAPVGIEADAVVSDNAHGAGTATRHLLEHGHRRIAYFGDRRDIQTAGDRRRGFVEEMATAGIPFSQLSIVEDLHDAESARLAVLELLASSVAPTAIFSSQNLVTMGAIRALRERGLHHEIALVGFDDIVLADMIDPAITVVAQNPQQIGALAAARLFARLDGDTSAEQTYVVSTELIVRGSGEIRPHD